MLQYLDTIIAFVAILLGVSLLITIMNQMISALMGYRGINLLWGIQTLLISAIKSDPANAKETAANAKEIAAEVLKKPIISDSIFSKFMRDLPILGRITKRWKLASAITPKELVHGLSNVAQTMPKTDDGKSTADLINGVLAQVDPEADRKAKMVLETLQKLCPYNAMQMDKVVQELETTMQGSIGKVEALFDTVMKRTSQRFTTQMRIWTMVFAFLLAFVAHLDSFEILKQLWNNPDQRSNLVGARETVLKEASIVLSSQDGTAQSSGPGVAPQILIDAMKRLKEKEKDATAGLPAETPRFYNLDEAVIWLRKNLKVDESYQNVLVAEYKNLLLTELKGHAINIKQELYKSGFQLIPTPYPGLLPDSVINLLGILATAGLLSLGAPFWFNVLKVLSNLRPLVANTSTSTTTGSTKS